VNRFGSPPARRELADEDRYRLPRARRGQTLYSASSVYITKAQKRWLREYGGGNISEGLRRLMILGGGPTAAGPEATAAAMDKLEAIFNGAAAAIPPIQESESE
jgi:hypothetical protein